MPVILPLLECEDPTGTAKTAIAFVIAYVASVPWGSVNTNAFSKPAVCFRWSILVAEKRQNIRLYIIVMLFTSFFPSTLKRSKTQVCYDHWPSFCDGNDVIVFSLSTLVHSNTIGLRFPKCRCLHSRRRYQNYALSMKTMSVFLIVVVWTVGGFQTR